MTCSLCYQWKENLSLCLQMAVFCLILCKRKFISTRSWPEKWLKRFKMINCVIWPFQYCLWRIVISYRSELCLNLSIFQCIHHTRLQFPSRSRKYRIDNDKIKNKFTGRSKEFTCIVVSVEEQIMISGSEICNGSFSLNIVRLRCTNWTYHEKDPQKKNLRNKRFRDNRHHGDAI